MMPAASPSLFVATMVLAAAAGAAATGPGEPCFLLRDVVDETGIAWADLSVSRTDKESVLDDDGSGVALVDYDLDGDLDLYFVNGTDLDDPAAATAGSALYRNDGGWRFVDVTERAGVRGASWAMGVAVGDLDGDGDPDLYVTRYGPNLLYRNRGDGTFEEIGEAAGVADPGWSHSAALGDFDGDGDLDLYVADYLVFDPTTAPGKTCRYREMAVTCVPFGFPPQADRLYWNDGAGRFVDGSESAGIHDVEPEFSMGVVLLDFDDDGKTDIYVANDSKANRLFQNLGGGKLEDVAWFAGVATQNEGRMQAGMGTDAGDFDGDGLVDLVVTNFALDHDTLYLNRGVGLFRDASYSSGLGGATWQQMSWGAKFVDFDSDGDLDLYIARGHLYPDVEADGRETYRQPDVLGLNEGSDQLSISNDRIDRPRGVASSRGVASGGLDLDGDPDLVVVDRDERPTLLRNEQTGCGGWLRVALRGSRPTDGEGARVRLSAGGRTQRRDVTRSGAYLSSSDVIQQFGLGAAAEVESLEVRWPDGARQRLLALPPARLVVIVAP